MLPCEMNFCGPEDCKISVKQGSKSLRKHQDSAEHLRAVAARKCTQDSKSALVALNDSQNLMLNPLIYHCLKSVRDGNSFRSSNDFTRDVRVYSKVFPDSKYTNIACEKTKATHVTVHGIGAWVVSQKVSQYFVHLALFLVFLSLRYGADSGRSRLVSIILSI